MNKFKVGDHVTNVPGKTHCIHGGCYYDGVVGKVTEQINAVTYIVKFSHAPRWMANDKELILATIPADFGVTKICSYCGELTSCKYESGEYWCYSCYVTKLKCCLCYKEVPEAKLIDGVYCSLACAKRHILQNQTISVYGLDNRIVLIEAAADFYLLSLYALETGDDYDFKSKAIELAQQFSAYMFIAVGGEVRYYGAEPRMTLAPSTFANITKKCFGGRSHEFKAWFLANSGRARPSRDAAWELWQEKSQEYGIIPMTKFALLLFSKKQIWFGDIGGEKWATITHTLLDYLEHRISPIVFVDTAFGLEHNGDIHFSKFWITWGLRETLNANLDGNYKFLLDRASYSVVRKVRCLVNTIAKK